MKIADAMQKVSRLFLDTAPVIYCAEKNPAYFLIAQAMFDLIDTGSLTGTPILPTSWSVPVV